MAHCHRQRQLSRLLVKLYEESASLRTSASTAALVAPTLCLLSAMVGCVQEEWTATPAGGPEYVGSPVAMIVRYSEGADKGAVRADIVEAVKGARPEEVLGTANAEVFAVEKPLEDAVRTAEALAGVKYAELDQSGFAHFSPDDVYYVRDQQWGRKR